MTERRSALTNSVSRLKHCQKCGHVLALRVEHVPARAVEEAALHGVALHQPARAAVGLIECHVIVPAQAAGGGETRYAAAHDGYSPDRKSVV